MFIGLSAVWILFFYMESVCEDDLFV